MHKPPNRVLNVVSMCSLLIVCGRTGFPERVTDVLQEATIRDTELNVQAYYATLATYLDGGLWMEAMELLEFMEGQRVQPDIVKFLI